MPPPAPDAERLAADADALAARAEALRARADALAQPVLPEDARQRLEATASLIPGTSFRERRCPPISRRRSSGTGAKASQGDMLVNSIIYLVGLIVIVLAVLSLVGLA